MRKFLENIVKNRRNGLAIELAAGMAAVVFALCAILTSLALYSSNVSRNCARRLEERNEINLIGEDFIANIDDLSGFDETLYPDYEITSSKTAEKADFTATNAKNGQELVIECKYNALTEKYEITKWSYGD